MIRVAIMVEMTIIAAEEVTMTVTEEVIMIVTEEVTAAGKEAVPAAVRTNLFSQEHLEVSRIRGLAAARPRKNKCIGKRQPFGVSLLY